MAQLKFSTNLIHAKKIAILSFFCFLIMFTFLNCPSQKQTTKFQLGSEVLLQEKLDLIKGKRVGIVTNQTGVDSKGNHIIDLLYNVPDVKLVALFCPEHGIRGDYEGGANIDNHVDEKTNVPIYSIYGETNKPLPEMLKNIDVLIFDIQSVGVRFYTYISTMSLCMEAAAENGIPFIVLDRPNPINGEIVEGPVLDPQYISFVGIHPIALRYGMTMGELAKMFNEEGWLADSVRADLQVVKMKNWSRDSWWDELGLKWIKPSPNMPSSLAALVYPGTGLLETCNISEGRGTDIPFINIGAPWLDNVSIKSILEQENIHGINIDTISFVPVDMPGAAMNPTYEGENCKGLIFNVTDPHHFESVAFGIHLICAIKKLHPDKLQWNSERSPLILFGNDSTPKKIKQGVAAGEIIQSWQADLEKFNIIRSKYLLYE